MLEVSRRTGRITIDHKASHSTHVTTAEMISDRTRKLREMRHSASIRGVSSSVTSMVAPSPCDLPITRASEPGWANMVRKVEWLTSGVDEAGSAISTVSAIGAVWPTGAATSRRPSGRATTIDLAPTVSRILSASSGGTSSLPVSPNSIIAL